MKNAIVFTFLIILCINCTKPALVKNEMVINTEKSIGIYDKYAVSSSIEVEIVKGNLSKIIITANERLHKKIVMEEKDGFFNISLNADKKQTDICKVKIITPKLSSLKATKLSNVKMLNFKEKFNRLDLELSNVSKITGDINVDSLYIISSNLAKLDLKGRSKLIDIYGMGASKINLNSFITQNAKIDLSNLARVTIQIDNILDVDLKDSSRLYFYGDAFIRKFDFQNIAGIKRLDR